MLYNNFWTEISKIDNYLETDSFVRKIEIINLFLFFYFSITGFANKSRKKLIISLLFFLLFIISFTKKYEIVNYFMENNGYRIGDMILYEKFKKQLNGKNFHLKFYPNSIVSEYLKLTDKVNDLSVLKKIVEKRKIKEYPTDKDLVIHLRLGDEVNKSTQYSIDYLLSDKINHQYIRNLSYYENIKIEQKIENIILVGNVFSGGDTRKTDDFSRSYEYVEKISCFYKSKGYNVKTKLNGDADEDFIFMSNSRHFISSGGGYSKLIENLIELK